MNDLLTHTITRRQNVRKFLNQSTYTSRRKVRPVLHNGFCRLTLSPKKALDFMCLQCKSFENTVGKVEIARNEQFLLFPQYFLAIWIPFCHFHQI